MSDSVRLDELRKELQDFGLPPELWDPESKLRRVYAQIVALRKEIHDRGQ